MDISDVSAQVAMHGTGGTCLHAKEPSIHILPSRVVTLGKVIACDLQLFKRLMGLWDLLWWIRE